MRLFLDSNAIIYLIEGNNLVRSVVQQRITAALSASNGLVLTSRISRLECRVLPMRKNDSAVLALYETFFSHSWIDIREIDAAVIEKATEIRANLNLRTPDAIQVAAAVTSSATLFLTGDKKLLRCNSLVPVEIVSP